MESEHAQPFRAGLAIAPGVLLAGAASGIAFPILPIAGARAGLPLAFIGAILAANRATRIVSSPIVGVLADRIGARRTLLAGLVIQIVVMLMYREGIVTGHPGAWFLAGRLLHGPGSSCVFVSGAALALHAGGKKASGRVGGSVRASMAIGVPIGLVAGGFLSEAIGDALTFLVAGAALVVATIGAYVLVPDLRVPIGGRPGLRGMFEGVLDRRLGALGALNFAATFAAGGVVLTTMVLLVHARGIAFPGLAERATAGVCMGSFVVVDALTMPFLGRLGDRGHHAKLVAFGIGMVPIGLVVIGLAHATATIALGLFVLGVGSGALGTSVLALVSEVAAPERRGAALGALQVCGDIGGAAGPMIGTALFASDVGLPYFVSAAIVAAFFPVALWLARIGRAVS